MLFALTKLMKNHIGNRLLVNIRENQIEVTKSHEKNLPADRVRDTKPDRNVILANRRYKTDCFKF